MEKTFILTESQITSLINNQALINEITSEEITAEAENVNLNPTESQKEAR